jgi:uncharacterized membrane protein
MNTLNKIRTLSKILVIPLAAITIYNLFENYVAIEGFKLGLQAQIDGNPTYQQQYNAIAKYCSGWNELKFIICPSNGQVQALHLTNFIYLWLPLLICIPLLIFAYVKPNARANHLQRIKNNYPKLMKIGVVVAVLFLIIGIVSYSMNYTSYSSPITVNSENGLTLSLVDTTYGEAASGNSFSVYVQSSMDIPVTLYFPDTFSVIHQYSGGYSSNSNFPLVGLPVGKYLFADTTNTLNATFTINYKPTITQINNSFNGIPTKIEINSNIGIIATLLIVIGIILLVAITIVAYAKSHYDLNRKLDGIPTNEILLNVLSI